MSVVQRTWQRMRRNRVIAISSSILAGLVLVSVIGPMLSPHDYLQTDFGNILQSPSLVGAHLFGTDDLGRDLFVRTLLGVQVTIIVALVASAVSLVIGVLYGAVADFARAFEAMLDGLAPAPWSR